MLHTIRSYQDSEYYITYFKWLTIRLFVRSIIKGTSKICPYNWDNSFFCEGIVLTQISNTDRKKAATPIVIFR